MTSADTTKPRIAILEDHDDTRELMLVFLENDFSVRDFKQVSDLLTALEEEKFAAIVADIMLPGVDGYHFIKIIRADHRFRDLPVIAVTALAMSSDRERGLAAGFADYLVKPIQPEDVIQAIWRCIKSRPHGTFPRCDSGLHRVSTTSDTVLPDVLLHSKFEKGLCDMVKPRGSIGGSSNPQPVHDNFVQFYEAEAYLCDAVSRFLAPGVNNGNPMIVIATPQHWNRIVEQLRLQGLDVESPVHNEQLIFLDAHQALSDLMVEGLPDRQRFKLTVGAVIDRARRGRENLAVLAFGEMVDILWREDKPDAAIRLEALWNELAGTYSFVLFRAYSINGFYRETHSPQFEEIGRYSRVVPSESDDRLSEDDRLREISLWQQRALALETELQRRKDMEQALTRALEERRQIEEKLSATEARLRDFFENAAVGLHWVAADGRITWANQAEIDLLGYSREEYIGRNIADFHVDAETIADIMTRLERNQTLLNYEARLRCKDGSIKYVLIDSNALFEDGKFVHTRCFTRDISDQKQKERLELLLSAIIESADDAIISKTLDGVVTSWNPAAQRLFGYSAEEIIGQSMLILIPSDRPDEEPQILSKLRRGQRIDHFETKRITKDGRIIDISLTVSPVVDKTGKIIGASKIARDISYRKRVDAEREQLLAQEKAARSEAERAQAEAEQANRLKDEFLAILSHELRTPLNAILGWASILASRNDEKSLQHAVDVIQRNAGLQKRLIEDLLDMSRILTGKMTIKSEEVDLKAVLNSAADSVRPAVNAKTIALEVAIDESVRFVIGDADRLQQVVWNLLANAVKFTPSNGKIDLVLRSTGSAVEIIVRDTGQGIKPDFLPYVFQRFRQADGSTTRQHGGLGLGLAVVRHLVEAHGGSVSANSEGEGLGATFIVALPRPRCPQNCLTGGAPLLLLIQLIDLYTIVILAAVILSWIRLSPDNPVVRFVNMLTEPVLAGARRIIPPMGGLDLSPMLVLIGLQVIRSFLIRGL